MDAAVSQAGVMSPAAAGWVASLKGHTAGVTAVEWTFVESLVLMSTSLDRTVRLWRLHSTPASDAAAGATVGRTTY